MVLMTVRPKVRHLRDKKRLLPCTFGEIYIPSFPYVHVPKVVKEGSSKTQATSIELTYVLVSFDAVLPACLSSPTNHVLLKIPANGSAYANGTAL